MVGQVTSRLRRKEMIGYLSKVDLPLSLWLDKLDDLAILYVLIGVYVVKWSVCNHLLDHSSTVKRSTSDLRAKVFLLDGSYDARHSRYLPHYFKSSMFLRHWRHDRLFQEPI